MCTNKILCNGLNSNIIDKLIKVVKKIWFVFRSFILLIL